MGLALSLLIEGFPERTVAFWRLGLDRLWKYVNANTQPIGYVMTFRGEPAGVILTIASDRVRERKTVNLSSWYVRDKYRWLAPRMLQRVVSNGEITYTDFSPSPEARKINEFLGFKTVTEKITVLPLPVTAVIGTGMGTVVPYSECPAEALTAEGHAMMRLHQELGCICATLKEGEQYRPLIFKRTAKFGLPVAQLVYVGDRGMISRAGLSISRFLLRQKILFMTLNTGRDEKLPGGIVRKRCAPVQVKGKWNDRQVDQTYSELVFLHD